MTKLNDQLQALASEDDVEGIALLLERWQDRAEEWLEAVEARLRAPSSTPDQRRRMLALRDAWRADSEGDRPPTTKERMEALRQEVLAAEAVAAAREPEPLRIQRPEYVDFTGSHGPGFEALSSAIRGYNAAITALPIDDEGDVYDLECVKLVEYPSASDGDLAALAAAWGGELSPALASFYRTIGGIGHRMGSENWTIEVYTPAGMLDDLGPQALGPSRSSLGLVDLIRWRWGNSRPEFDPGVNLSQRDISTLNTGYLGFGWWSHDWGFEASYYLFTDPKGRASRVYYHQDEGEIFDQLQALLNGEAKWQTLEDELVATVHAVQAGRIRDWTE